MSERMPGRRITAVAAAASLLVFMALVIPRLVQPHADGVSASGASAAMSHHAPSALRHTASFSPRGTTVSVNEFMKVSGASSFTTPETSSSSPNRIGGDGFADAALRRGYDAAAPPRLLKA